MGGMRRRLAAVVAVRLAASLAPPSPPTNQLVPSPLVFGTLRLHEAPPVSYTHLTLPTIYSV